MNRYRTIPGLGQPKASPTTTCQKCLKKDNYECKSTTQERPYISRPSRTQQLLNPKLKPKLNSDIGNGLMQSEGIADQELARAKAARESAADKNATLRRSRSPQPQGPTSHRARSASASSYDSVSTISTSRSRSPRSRRRTSPGNADRRADARSPSRSLSRSRKRKFRESSVSRSPPRHESTNKSRRYRSDSPEDRGRPADNRRGSNRSRSREMSSNRSEITRHRRSLDDVYEPDARGAREPLRQPGNQGSYRRPPVRKERSLSPYSRRLALTQAMNMGR